VSEFKGDFKFTSIYTLGAIYRLARQWVLPYGFRERPSPAVSHHRLPVSLRRPLGSMPQIHDLFLMGYRFKLTSLLVRYYTLIWVPATLLATLLTTYTIPLVYHSPDDVPGFIFFITCTCCLNDSVRLFTNAASIFRSPLPGYAVRIVVDGRAILGVSILSTFDPPIGA
jgi:hypothetical protein